MGDTKRWNHARDQVIKVSKMMVGEDDTFVQTLGTIDHIKNQRGHVDENTIREIRQHLQNCLAWSTTLETQISQCMEAVRSAPHKSADVSSSSSNSGGGSSGSTTSGKREPKIPNPKPIKLSHLHRMPEPGDQVAAKIASHDLWVLTSVISYNGITEIVEVQDEDDVGE